MPGQSVFVDEHLARRWALWARGSLWLAVANAILALWHGRGRWEGERDYGYGELPEDDGWVRRRGGRWVWKRGCASSCTPAG